MNLRFGKDASGLGWVETAWFQWWETPRKLRIDSWKCLAEETATTEDTLLTPEVFYNDFNSSSWGRGARFRIKPTSKQVFLFELPSRGGLSCSAYGTFIPISRGID